MDPYKTEEEQVEALKKWWQENGKSIAAGVVIGLVSIFGWRGYNQHLDQQTQIASTLYEQMIAATRNQDFDDSRNYAERIIGEHDSTAYAVFARLMLAKLATQDNALDEAETHLRWVLDNNDLNELEHVATLRLARVYIAADKLDQANKLLNTSKTGKFLARYSELRGDLLVKQGKPDEARAAYEKALANTIATEEAQSILEMKLDDLGRG